MFYKPCIFADVMQFFKHKCSKFVPQCCCHSLVLLYPELSGERLATISRKTVNEHCAHAQFSNICAQSSRTRDFWHDEIVTPVELWPVYLTCV